MRVALQFLADQDLQCALSVGERYKSLTAARITTLDFQDHFIYHRFLAFQQTGPDALVFGAGRRR